MLLDLADRDPRANGVHGSGGHKESITRFYVNPVQKPFDLAVQRRLAQSLAADLLAKTECDLSAGVGSQDVPHLRLAKRLLVDGGEAIIRMHLHRETPGGEHKLHQQG